MEQVKFKLQGLTCEACVKIVKSRLLKRINGVETIEAQKNGDVAITSNFLVTKEMIDHALYDTEFKFISFK